MPMSFPHRGSASLGYENGHYRNLFWSSHVVGAGECRRSNAIGVLHVLWIANNHVVRTCHHRLSPGSLKGEATVGITNHEVQHLDPAGPKRLPAVRVCRPSWPLVSIPELARRH